MKISFCIPSLNRAEYLLRGIESICCDPKYSDQFEVCIFNNCSEQSYQEVEVEIEKLSTIYNINYKKSKTRLDIDMSMYSVMELAKGTYLFLLGDDDHLRTNGLDDIFSLIENDNFDLAIFNATLVRESSNSRPKLIGRSNERYENLSVALVELKPYCMYGNLLIKSEFIQFDDFKYLIGTSHAYGCFWIRFLDNYENGVNPIIIIPQEPVVNMTVVEKNYNLLEVVFKHAALEHKLYYNLVGPKSKTILQKFESNFWKKQTSLKQLVVFEVLGHDILTIKKYDDQLYKKMYFKILAAKALSFVVKRNKARIKKVISFFK